MTKTLVQAMADGDDLSKLFPNSDVNNNPVTQTSPGSVIEPGKVTDGTETPVDTGIFSPEEKEILTSGLTGPGKNQRKEEPSTIPGSNFVTAEQAAEAFKNSQRTIARKDQEIDQLRKQIENDTPAMIQSKVREELEKLLRETPAQETEEEKALKEDDPDAYKMLQLEKQFKSRSAKQDADLQNLQKVIVEMRQAEKAKDITSEFQRVSEAKKIPLNLLIAYGSLRQYAETSPEDLVDIVVKDMAKSGITLSQLPKDSAPVIPKETDDLRTPVTNGSAAVANDSINIEAVGPIGSREWKNFRKKLVDVAFNRQQGGAR